MTLEKLRAQQTQLLLQRSQARDAMENCDRVLQQIGFAIKVLEENQKDQPEPTE